MRENILNGRWFISFTPEGNGIEYVGEILGEVSDGWFYVSVRNTGLSEIAKRVVPVAEFERCRFYISETSLLPVVRSFDKPILQRTGDKNEG
jgi:hypothetical protein